MMMRLSISRETLSLAIKSVKRKVGQKNVHDSRYRGSSPGSRKPIRKKSCFANDLRHRIHFSCCYQNIAEQIHCFRNVNIKMFLKLYTNFHAIDVQILCQKRQHQNVLEIVYQFSCNRRADTLSETSTSKCFWNCVYQFSCNRRNCDFCQLHIDN